MDPSTNGGNDLAPQSARMLVIDDDEATQLLFDAIFRRRGLTVDCAGDGVAALHRIRRQQYDVIILDLMIPDPNGFEIIREIRSRNASLLARTIVVTAADDMVLRDFADAARVRRVLRKPFGLAEITAEVLALTPAALVRHPADVPPEQRVR